MYEDHPGCKLVDSSAAEVVYKGQGGEGADEAILCAARLVGQLRAGVAAGVDERVELAVLVAGGKDRHAEVAVREVAAGARQLRRQANDLRVLLKKGFPLALGERGVGVDVGGVDHDAARLPSRLALHRMDQISYLPSYTYYVSPKPQVINL